MSREEFINLYIIYSDLLTINQKNYFKSYYFEDLSLSEIAENYNVSKTLIGKTLKQVENKLIDLENSLKINKVLNKLEAIKDRTNNKDVITEIDSILNIYDVKE